MMMKSIFMRQIFIIFMYYRNQDFFLRVHDSSGSFKFIKTSVKTKKNNLNRITLSNFNDQIHKKLGQFYNFHVSYNFCVSVFCCYKKMKPRSTNFSSFHTTLYFINLFTIYKFHHNRIKPKEIAQNISHYT